MKRINYLLSFMVLTAIMLTTSCDDGDDSGPTIQEQQLAAVLGTWATQSTSDVKLDQDDAPGDWSDFSLTFNNQNGVVATGIPPESEVFSLTSFETTGNSASQFQLIFNGASAENASLSISGGTMELSFTLSSDTDQLGARVNSVEGDWTFSLTKTE